MRKHCLLNTLLVLSLCLGHTAHANRIGIAATVQGIDISEHRLQKSIDAYLQQQGISMGIISDPRRYKTIREKVLNVLIGQELLWQAAIKGKTIASDDEVSQAFEQYRAQFDDELSFTIKLQGDGYTETTFQDNLKQQLSAQKWIEKFVLRDVSVSDSEVHAFYLENQQQFTEPEEIRARHILIQVSQQASNADRESAIKLLTDIKKQITSGADFGAMAKARSQDSSAADGGDLGFFKRGQMVKPFEQAAFGLVTGEVSDIVETRFGFHLIQLLERRPPVELEEKDQSEKIRFYLWQNKYQKALEAAIAKLKTDALIEKNTF